MQRAQAAIAACSATMSRATPISAGHWCCDRDSGTVERKIGAMTTSSGWWMYHGDPAHTGFVGSGSAIDATALSAGKFEVLHTLNVGGSILSVPAVTEGHIYVGLANSRAVAG